MSVNSPPSTGILWSTDKGQSYFERGNCNAFFTVHSTRCSLSHSDMNCGGSTKREMNKYDYARDKTIYQLMQRDESLMIIMKTEGKESEFHEASPFTGFNSSC